MIDTSATYIEMCRKAEELQKVWEPQVYDDVVCLPLERNFPPDDYIGKVHSWGMRNKPWVVYQKIKHLGNYDSTTIDFDAPKEEYIWLPRQDQLQEMVIRKYRKMKPAFGFLIWDFSKFAEKSEKIHKHCKTMEQLWLAFFMDQKYGKIWNGKEWVSKRAAESGIINTKYMEMEGL